MILDTDKRWAYNNKNTKVTWSEEEVHKEWLRGADIEWCKIMMVGILGSTVVAMDKYPEYFI